MSISSLEFTKYDLSLLKEGDEFNILNNIPICNKYVIKATKLKTKLVFHEHVDTKQIRYYLNSIPLDSNIIITTNKNHGTSVRLAFGMTQ
jgi:hypothetical protein